MFKGYAGLSFEGSHLDISWRDRDAWPSLTPMGSLKSFAFDIGDPDVGPTVLLGLTTKVEGEDLDWKHSIDPVHHHGTDQFRLVVEGEAMLAGKPLQAGVFGFQEAGWVYQEHPIHGGPLWLLLIMGDRRGTRATLKLKKDMATVIDGGELNEAFGAPVQGGIYPHPAGDKGVTAVATTLGPCTRGYLSAQLSDLGADGGAPAATGVLGDVTAGPVVHALKAEANETVVPACTYPTELVLVVQNGSCRIGDREYQAGDLRVQRADAPLSPVVAGTGGAQIILIVADRRARAIMDEGLAAPDWMADVDRVLGDLSPAPGGVEGFRQRQRALEGADA